MMKAIRDVNYFFQEESFIIKNNQPISTHTALIQRLCACLKVSKNTVRRSEFEKSETCHSPGKKRFCF
jgi:hypothetical protein